MCHFAADCCFTLRLLVLDYQSAILEMQREEANQRLRELEEGENYFIILPDSVRQRRSRASKYNKVYNKDRISQISPEASSYRGTAVTALRTLPLSIPASSQLLREIDMLEIQFQIERSCRESAEALAVKVKPFGLKYPFPLTYDENPSSLFSPDEQREQGPEEGEPRPDAAHPRAVRRPRRSDL